MGAKIAAGVSSPPSTGGEVSRAKPETERGSTFTYAIASIVPPVGMFGAVLLSVMTRS
jgi:hypothetical protein